MNEEIKLFSFLLPLNEIKMLYLNIGVTLFCEADFKGEANASLAIANSIELLKKLDIVEIKGKKYFKKENLCEDLFSEMLYGKIMDVYQGEILKIFCDKTQYDIDNKVVFIFRNKIPLKFSGLIMLLNDMKKVYFIDNKVVLCKSFTNSFDEIKENSVRKMSLEKLIELIDRNNELGEQAEQFVLDYEKEKLKVQGINKELVQISKVDVTAGFDILSYFSEDDADEKYIEVKSCGPNDEFYFSENEKEFSRIKQSRYFLYLYNRERESIMEIQNPHNFFFNQKNPDWVVGTSNYRIRKL